MINNILEVISEFSMSGLAVSNSQGVLYNAFSPNQNVGFLEVVTI
jgi:hypothetical protein